jgi:hypothetical protein
MRFRLLDFMASSKKLSEFSCVKRYINTSMQMYVNVSSISHIPFHSISFRWDTELSFCLSLSLPLLSPPSL